MEYDQLLVRLRNLFLFSEHQYIFAAVNSTSPILRKFLEKRAFERMEFIEELEMALHPDENSEYPFKNLKDLYNWHQDRYGKESLRNAFIQDLYSKMVGDNAIDPITIDKQSLEICGHLFTICLPSKIQGVLLRQVIHLKSGIVCMAALRENTKDSKN